MVRAITAAAVVIILCLGTAWAADEGFRDLLKDDPVSQKAQKEAEITKHFKSAMNLLEKAKYPEAKAELEAALTLSPEPMLARKLRNETSQQVILGTFTAAPFDTIDVLKQFLAIAEKGRREWMQDKARIAELVDTVIKGEFDRMWVAIHELETAGHYAVPQLVERLKDANRETRSKVSMALIANGPPAVLPLCEALKSSDPLSKQQIVFILGQIKDSRALPALAAAAGASPALKADALETIKAITGTADIRPAAVYYLDLAESYYKRRIEVQQSGADDYVIWTWDDKAQKLNSRAVPEYAFYLEMAEKCCYEAAALDPSFDAVFPQLVCIYYQQLHVCNLLADAAAKGRAELSEDEIAGIKARRDRVAEILRTAPALGKQHYYGALKLALADKNDPVASMCAEELRRLGSSADLPVPVVGKNGGRNITEVAANADPLIAALDSPDKEVRYRAAATLASLAGRSFDNAEKVANIVCQALGERGTLVALVANADIQVVNQLKGDLKNLGYIVDTAADANAAVAAAFVVPMKDVLILDAAFDKAIATLAGDYRTRNIPFVIVGDQAAAKDLKEKYGDKLLGVVGKPVDAAALRKLLNQAVSAEIKETSKGFALRMNHLAAQTLANVDVATTSLPMQSAEGALIRALELPDEIRLEAMIALGNIGSAAAQPGLALVAKDTKNSQEARVGALEALAAIGVKLGGLTSGVTETAEQLLLDADAQIRNAAARLIGVAASTASPVKRLIGDAKWVGAAAAPAPKEPAAKAK